MAAFPLKPELQTKEERELIASCQTGDLDAFNILISRYETRVINLTLRYLRNYDLAMEEAQEVFIKIFRRIKAYRGESAFSTWLYRVTTNHCFTVLDRQKNRQRSEVKMSLDESQEEGMQANLRDRKAVSAEEILTQEETQAAMADALAKLPADQRQAIILHHYEELDYKQIAEVMAVPVSTVTSCLHRARQQLRKIIIQQKGGQNR